MPPAPETFSTTTCWRRTSARCCCSTRASVSIGPPAANGTTMVTGRFGQSCACAALVHTVPITAAAIRIARMVSSLVAALTLSTALAGEHSHDRVPDGMHKQREPGDRLCGGGHIGSRRLARDRGRLALRRDGATRDHVGAKRVGKLLHQLRGGRLDDADAAAVLCD